MQASALNRAGASRAWTIQRVQRCVRVQPFRPLTSSALIRPRRAAAVPVRAAAEQEASATVPAAPATAPAPPEYVEDTEFNLAKISFGSILTPLGVFLLAYGFGAYFMLLPGADISSVMLIYGFPLSLLGFALSYAQLEPVPCKTTRAALEQRASQATDIHTQIREDVTRFRYGDEQHLDEALEKVFKLGRSGGVPRKLTPKLRGLREEVTSTGNYTLILEFSSKLELEKWEEFQPKIQSFFGPGIVAELYKTDQGVDVSLISDGSGEGRGGIARPAALPPLMPGLPVRQQESQK